MQRTDQALVWSLSSDCFLGEYSCPASLRGLTSEPQHPSGTLGTVADSTHNTMQYNTYYNTDIQYNTRTSEPRRLSVTLCTAVGSEQVKTTPPSLNTKRPYTARNSSVYSVVKLKSFMRGSLRKITLKKNCIKGSSDAFQRECHLLNVLSGSAALHCAPPHFYPLVYSFPSHTE